MIMPGEIPFSVTKREGELITRYGLGHLRTSTGAARDRLTSTEMHLGLRENSKVKCGVKSWPELQRNKGRFQKRGFSC